MITEKQPPTQRAFRQESRPARYGWRAEHGFTIVEVIVASLVLIVGALSLVALVDAANGATTSNKQREAGTNLARELIENAGTVAYDDVTPDGVTAALQARDGLEDSDGGIYTLERRGVTFTVDVEICNLDDASDGIGSHDTGSDGVPFCSDSGPSGGADDRPGDYRRATANVAWTLEGQTKNVRQSSFVMPPSGSELPVVTTLTHSPSTPIENPVEEVEFTGTTSSIPGGVSWSQDGTDKGEASGSGTGPWRFTWPIGDVATGLADGSYVIGARARTGAGSYGPVHALTMKLNRSLPAAPRNFVAGKNGSSVDTEWLANRERDVEGYTVYRQQTAPSSGAAQQVNCGTVGTPVYITTSLTCTDAAPITPEPGFVSYVASAQASAEGGAPTISVNRPAGVVAGDVLIATVASTTAAAITAPAGWTSIQNSATSGASAIRSASYYRVVPVGTEPPSYTWNQGGSRSTSASITAGRGADTSSPIDVSAQQNSGGSNGATETAPAVTTTGANRTILRTFAHTGPANSTRTLSTPSGHTLLAGASSASSIHARSSIFKLGAGTQAAATSACSGTCRTWVAHSIALRPASTVQAEYWVKALDLDSAGTYREGAASSPVAAYATNLAPTAPAGLTSTAAANGSNELAWTTQGTDPDSGDSVAFYRIYRDGVSFDRTATGTDTSWTDARPGSGTHTYFLKAVDTHLAESPATASVTATQP